MQILPKGLPGLRAARSRHTRRKVVEARPLADRHGFWHLCPFYQISPFVPQAVFDDLTESDSCAAAD